MYVQDRFMNPSTLSAVTHGRFEMFHFWIFYLTLWTQEVCPWISLHQSMIMRRHALIAKGRVLSE